MYIKYLSSMQFKQVEIPKRHILHLLILTAVIDRLGQAEQLWKVQV